MINRLVNEKILALWHKHFGSVSDVNAPIFYDDFKQGGLLFIGMNPSLSVKGIRHIVRGTEYEQTVPEPFWQWDANAWNEERIDTSIRINRIFFEKYGFFKRMHEIAKACNTDFQHLDLFVYRQTKQNDFLQLVRDKKGVLNELGKDQLDIFLQLLNEIHPTVIIVSNAGSSGIIREHFKDKLAWDEARGFHWLTLNDKRVPIFFSSMLNGQRALDNGSYERLLWHIKQAIS